jgi:hypothetical protein
MKFTDGVIGRHLPTLFALAIPVVSSKSADLSSFAVYKGNGYQQEFVPLNEAPRPSGYRLFVFEPQFLGSSLIEGFLQSPPLDWRIPPTSLGQGYFAQGGLWNSWSSDSAARLNNFWPAGTYSASLESAHDGLQSFSFSFPSDDYPTSIPKVHPFPGFQYYDEAAPMFWATPIPYFPTNVLELSWDEFLDRKPDDFIQIAIGLFEESGVRTVFKTPEYGQPGAIPASATTYTIPASTLPDNQRFLVFLRFVRVSAVDETSIPGSNGVIGFFTENEFYMRTGTAWYGEPSPDNNPPRLSSISVLTPTRKTSFGFTFSESIGTEPQVTCSNALILSQHWNSWQRDYLEVEVFVEYDTEVTWKLDNVKDLAGNPLREQDTTGTFRTRPAPELYFSRSYPQPDGSIGYQLAVPTQQKKVIIESSTDMRSWQPIATNTVTGTHVQLQLDPRKTTAQFLRAIAP